MPTSDNPRLVLALKVRSLRQRRRETLRTVAERSGLSISYLSEIEKGKKYPKPERLVRLADALEVPFDELVSLQLAKELTPLKVAFDSSLLRGFPFDLFGLEPEDLMALVTGDPERGGALLRAVAEVGRSYDVHVEHFLLAALRAYQQLHANYFEDLEQEASAFRRKIGLAIEDRLGAERLAEVLENRWGFRIDRRRLSSVAELAEFRSVFNPGDPATLHVNSRLLPSQQAFVLAREIAYQHLGLSERASSSPWLQVESFSRVFNNFKASYFAGALIMDRRSLRRDLEDVFACRVWDSEILDRLLDHYGVTPETFLHRLTQIAPRFFGLHEYFFLRFSASSVAPGAGLRLTKWLNTSSVPVPRGFGLSEHYCRRWPAVELLARGSAELPAPREHLISARRVDFVDEGTEFLELSMARRMALRSGIVSAVSVGFVMNPRLQKTIRFAADPAVRHTYVGLTCERCRIEDCGERVAPATVLSDRHRQDERSKALEALLARH